MADIELSVDCATSFETEPNAIHSEPQRCPDDQWDMVIRPSRSVLDFNLGEVWDYRDLLLMFVKRDIVTVYKQTILGPIWFFVQPIMTTLVYLFVFGKIANLSTDGVPGILFYLAGIVMWNYFSESFNNTSTTFKTNAHIFGKVYFPRLIMPLSTVASGLIKFLIQFGLFLAVWGYYIATTDLIHPNAWMIGTVYLLVLMAAMGLGFGILFSSLTTKYRDLVFVIQFGVQLVMYATPVIYPMSSLGQQARSILWWNPLTHIIEAFKHAYLGAGELSFSGLAYATLFSVCVLMIGVIVFNRTERTFMDTV